MEWSDEGIVIGVRRHGESAVILEAMTRGHGRHLGLVRGGRSARMQPLLQPGNEVSLVWRARLEEHLGNFAIEAGELHAARLLGDALALFGLTHVAGLLRLLPERDAHEGLFEALKVVLAHLGEPRLAGPLVVRFEMALLAELGFGLDLSACAATGAREELTHVSPRSGRAVSRLAAAPYAGRLLPLPRFLGTTGAGDLDIAEVEAGFTLTGHFLRRHVYEPRGLAEPEARMAFLAAMRRGF